VYRENAEACCIGARHNIGNRREIDLEWIDMVVLKINLACQPLREILKIQDAMRWQLRFPLLIGNDCQGMRDLALQACIGKQYFCFGFGNEAIFDQQTKQFRYRKAVFRYGIRHLAKHLCHPKKVIRRLYPTSQTWLNADDNTGK